MKRIKFNPGQATIAPLWNTNYMLIGLVGLLSIVGLITLFSASVHLELPFFKKVVGRQLLWMLVGASLAISLQFFQKKIIYDSVYILYAAGLFFLILPYFIGPSTAGTARWLILGPLHFQPSEFMKIIVILAISKHLSRRDLSISEFQSLLPAIALALIPMAIILKQPDLGTSMIYFGILFPLFFWAGVRLFHIFLILAPFISIVTAFNFYTFFIWVVIIVVVLYFSKINLVTALIIGLLNLSLGLATPVLWNRLEPYQQNRILTLFNVGADPQGAGYQVIQSQIAIGSGGLFGKGLGKGTQTHLKFLPEQHNDFIFSVIGEEYGFIGVGIVLALFLLLIILLISIAFRQRDRFNSLVILGVASALFFHIAINVAMTIGLMPVTGLPLPLLSYGGSFVLTCYGMIGIVLSINSERSQTKVELRK